MDYEPQIGDRVRYVGPGETVTGIVARRYFPRVRMRTDQGDTFSPHIRDLELVEPAKPAKPPRRQDASRPA